jgi:hypothetical protein
VNKLIRVLILLALAAPSLAQLHFQPFEDFLRRLPVPAVFFLKEVDKGWVDCLICSTRNDHVDFLWAGMGSMPRVAGNHIKVWNGSVVVDVEIGRVLTSGQQVFVSGNVGSVSFGATVGAIDDGKLSIKISGSTFHSITRVYSKRQIEEFIVDAKRRLNYHNRDMTSMIGEDRRNTWERISFSGSQREFSVSFGGSTFRSN